MRANFLVLAALTLLMAAQQALAHDDQAITAFRDTVAR
jgi:hypothetical protein